MKAVVAEKYGKPSELKIVEMPAPDPKENEVQIAVEYTAVNPVDWKILEGYFDSYPHEFPFVLGWDAAGTVRKTGKKVAAFQEGDEVYCYCRKPKIQWGTYAEYICMEEAHVALKPKNLNFAQAASIPLAGLTAWQALFDAGKLQENEKILIHAGAGGVGGMAIQFAKNRGAFVITTASTENFSYVKKLGADLAIDYREEDFAKRIRKEFPEGIDFALDTIGGETCRKNFSILKSNGRLVSLLEQFGENNPPPKDIACHFVFVEPNGQQLQQIAELIEQGKVIAPKIHEMRLEEAAKALQESRQGHVAGKIVLNVHAA
ncbi:MAG: NADP-dependent oxidoreductase [Simkaniaceae bacterium]